MKIKRKNEEKKDRQRKKNSYSKERNRILNGNEEYEKLRREDDSRRMRIKRSNDLKFNSKQKRRNAKRIKKTRMNERSKIDADVKSYLSMKKHSQRGRRDFSVDPEDMKSTRDEIDYSQTELIDDPKDPSVVGGKKVISQDDTGMNNNSDTNEEVLIVNRNQEMVDDVLIIASGQNKKPISSQRFENFQEFCFPRTYGGHAIDENRILSYSERMKYEIRNVDRRSCKTTLLLLMAKLELEMSVVSSVNPCLRKTLKSDNLGAKDVREISKIDDFVRYDDGYRFLKQIRFSTG
ncbi:hypothetical protein QAD02_002993 [Eretmocerus hayati]|uniref:Uncharacterized protein n=1 Tax=Eretmocerus hayati TaxID=131215 RepID=A0ACC2NN45_9HYME|nr:hypothetical protein QAD02_002993 [Eretmocerus hayati]